MVKYIPNPIFKRIKICFRIIGHKKLLAPNGHVNLNTFLIYKNIVEKFFCRKTVNGKGNTYWTIRISCVTLRHFLASHDSRYIGHAIEIASSIEELKKA